MVPAPAAVAVDQVEGACGWPVSMPSASTSTLSRPSASRSSLSHWMTVRSGIAAFSIGTSSRQRPAGDDEAADVLRQVAREAEHLRRPAPASRRMRGLSGSKPASRRRSAQHAARRPTRPATAPGASTCAGVEAQRLAHVAHRAARRGSVITVAASAARSRPYLRVDVLDDLLAPLVLEVDVDVRRLVALARDEALEQQVHARRVDLGDAQAVADRRVGRRAAALAEDALRRGRSGRCPSTVRK